MRFEVTGSPAERELKAELNVLFDKEEHELLKLAEPYFLVVDNDGIVLATRNMDTGEYEIGAHSFPKDKVERLIEKKQLGSYSLGVSYLEWMEKVLLFDNFDARFNYAAKHPVGIEAYYELKCKAGYEDEYIPSLLEEVLSKYDKLKEKGFYRTRGKHKKLAAAIALTCRGKHQCPTNMREYFKKAGGLTVVHEAGEIIGESLTYDPEKRLRSYLHKLKKTLDLDKEFVKTFLELWKGEKGKKVSVTPGYVGGLAYVTSRLTHSHLTAREISEVLSVTTTAIRNQSKKIVNRQKILSYNTLNEISTEFREKLGCQTRISPRAARSPLQEVRLKITNYLLENKHDENNPVSVTELLGDLSISPSEFNQAVNTHTNISPVNAGICNDDWRRSESGEIYIKDRRRTRTYVRLMRKLVKMKRAKV